MSKTVLIVAYQSPLCATAGAARIRRFAKYLPQCGWKPVILTTRKRYLQYHSPLELGLRATEISVAPSFEVSDLGFLKPLSRWARPKTASVAHCNQVMAPMPHHQALEEGITNRLNKYLVPDLAVSWFLPAVLRGVQLFRRHHYDMLIATSPLPTAVLVSVALKRILHVPLVLDFRDPWIGHFDSVYPTRVHLRANRFLEGKAVEAADVVVCVTDSMAEELSSRWGIQSKTVSIPNGYDPHEAGQTMLEHEPRKEKKWRLLYAGSFAAHSSPACFLEGLRLFLNSNEQARDEVEVRFVGHIADEVHTLCDAFGVSEVVRILPWRSRPEILKEISAADVLVQILSGERMGYVVGSKLCDYLRHNHTAPILGAVPRNGEADALIRKTNSGVTADGRDPHDIAEKIAMLYRSRGIPWGRTGIESLDGSNLTRELAAIMDGVVCNCPTR